MKKTIRNTVWTAFYYCTDPLRDTSCKKKNTIKHYSFSYMQHCSTLLFLILVPVTRLGHHCGAIGLRSLRPSGDQHKPADGGRSACTGKLYTPLDSVGEGRGGVVSWMTDCCSKVKGSNLWHFTSSPVSISLQPRPPAFTTCACVLLPCSGQQHLWHTIMFFRQNTHTKIIQSLLDIT